MTQSGGLARMTKSGGTKNFYIALVRGTRNSRIKTILLCYLAIPPAILMTKISMCFVCHEPRRRNTTQVRLGLD